jgi:hypothetical protein
MEAIAFAIICYFLCKDCSRAERWKKAGGGAVLFIALFLSYNTLQPLLPTEIDTILHSTIWGVLCAYAVPNTKTDKQNEDCNEKDGAEKKPQEDETPPISDLN